ncbi:MAG: tyrosine-type recombinase/integrase [Myxococcota bacterium]
MKEKLETLPTLAEYVPHYLEMKAPRLKPGGLEDLRSKLVHHVLPVFGGRRLDEIGAIDVLQWHVSQKGQIAPRSALAYLFVLSNVYKFARLQWPSLVNPCDLPRGMRLSDVDADGFDRQAKIYTVEEAELLCTSPDIAPARRIRYATLYWTGMRSGEMCALRFSSIFDAKPLRGFVIDSNIDGKDRFQLGTTKTGETRKHPIHPYLDQMLREWVAIWPELHERTPGPDDFLFPRRHRYTGEFTHSIPKRVWEQLKADMRRVGFPEARCKVLRLHDFRRTWISRVDEFGAIESDRVRITHTRGSDVQSGYLEKSWPKLCAVAMRMPAPGYTPAAPELEPPAESKPAGELVTLSKADLASLLRELQG